MIKVLKYDQDTSKAVLTYAFDEDEIEILLVLKERGYVDFKNTSDHGINLDVADDLIENGFVEDDDHSMYASLVLTELGQELVDQMG